LAGLGHGQVITLKAVSGPTLMTALALVPLKMTP